MALNSWQNVQAANLDAATVSVGESRTGQFTGALSQQELAVGLCYLGRELGVRMPRCRDLVHSIHAEPTVVGRMPRLGQQRMHTGNVVEGAGTNDGA